MKTISADILRIICLVLIIGRLAGVPGGTSVYLQPADGDTGIPTKTTASGYFMAETLKGGKWSLCLENGFCADLTVPESGIYFFELEASPLTSALESLQRATGLRK